MHLGSSDVVEAGYIQGDERFVLGSGWLYEQFFKIEQLGKQQDGVAQYLDTAKEVLFGGTKGSVRALMWASEKDRVDFREKLEWEARGKGRKSNVPFPKAFGSGNSVSGWHLWICWTPSRISLSRRSPRRFRRSQENMITSTTPIDLARTMTTFDGHSQGHSPRTVNSRTHTRSSSRCFPPPICPPTHITRSGRLC